MLNSLFIETVEAFPDTTVTLTNGKKYVVRETVEEVEERVHAFYQTINLLGKIDTGGSVDEE